MATATPGSRAVMCSPGSAFPEVPFSRKRRSPGSDVWQLPLPRLVASEREWCFFLPCTFQTVFKCLSLVKYKPWPGENSAGNRFFQASGPCNLGKRSEGYQEAEDGNIIPDASVGTKCHVHVLYSPEASSSGLGNSCPAWT